MKTLKTTDKITFPELRGNLDHIQFPAFVEPKLDGELNKYEDGKLINKYGKQRCDFPALDQLPDKTLIGELYYADGKRNRLYDLLKHKEDDSLNFMVFDIVNFVEPLVERRERLLHLVPKNQVIPVILVNNISEALAAAKQWVSEDYEGAVVKSLNGLYREGPCGWVKIKAKDQTYYYLHSIDPVLERIEILVPLPPPGPTHIAVGVKCVNKYKKNLKIGQKVLIEHQGVLPSGSLRHPVYIHENDMQ